MKYLLAGMVLLLVALQYRLWFAEGSLAERHRLQQQVQREEAVNSELRARNAVLEREVLDLQSGNDGLEQRAREQLGLVREGEVFYQVVPEAAKEQTPAQPPRAEPVE
jgi:cell division protein FtsB